MAQPTFNPAGLNSSEPLSAGLSSPSSGPGASAHVPKPVALPEDMAGWLSTAEAASRLGMTDKRLGEYSSAHSLPKRNVGKRVFYSPDVIEAEAERIARQKKQKASAQAKTTPPVSAKAAARGAVPTSPVSDQFFIEALAAVRQIVTSHDRARR